MCVCLDPQMEHEEEVSDFFVLSNIFSPSAVDAQSEEQPTAQNLCKK